MSNNTREFDQNRETVARVLSNFQRERDDKCYCNSKSCNDLKTRRIKIKITKRHCRESGHIEGDLIIIHCKLFVIFFS